MLAPQHDHEERATDQDADGVADEPQDGVPDELEERADRRVLELALFERLQREIPIRSVNGESKTPDALNSAYTSSQSFQRGYSAAQVAGAAEPVELAPVRAHAEIGEPLLVAGEQLVPRRVPVGQDQLDHHRRLPCIIDA